MRKWWWGKMSIVPEKIRRVRADLHRYISWTGDRRNGGWCHKRESERQLLGASDAITYWFFPHDSHMFRRLGQEAVSHVMLLDAAGTAAAAEAQNRHLIIIMMRRWQKHTSRSDCNNQQAALVWTWGLCYLLRCYAVALQQSQHDRLSSVTWGRIYKVDATMWATGD